jgi:hypothetical protein
VQTSKPEELYDELAKRIRAEDGPGTQQVYRQLVNAGCPRQEILSQISRLIEKRGLDKASTNVMGEIRWPKPQPMEPSQAEAQQNSGARPGAATGDAADQWQDVSAGRTSRNPEMAWTEPDTPQRAGGSSGLSPERQETAFSGYSREALINHKGVGDDENAIQSFEECRGIFSGSITPKQIRISLERGDLNMAERVTSALQVKGDISAPEATQTAPAEAVSLSDRVNPAQRGSGGWYRTLRTILVGASVFAITAAGFFAVWGLKGGLEELSWLNARPALSWLHGARLTSFWSRSGPKTPTEKTDAQQPTTDHENDIGSTTAAAAQNAVGDRADGRIDPITSAAPTRATAEVAKDTPSRGEAPVPQTAERAILPGSTLSRSPQNETNAGQQSQTAGPQLPQRDTGLLLDRGDQFLSTSDIASARLYYQRAAEAGDARGALRMGMTFDPVFLARLRLRGFGAAAAHAIAWYHRASALGNSEAELLEKEVDTFSRGTSSASGSTTGVARHQPRQPRVAARSQRNSYAPHRARGTAAKRG